LEAGKVGYTPGYSLASADSVDIKIRGLGGHGAAPETTKDPIVVAAEVVLALQTIVSRENSPLDPAVSPSARFTVAANTTSFLMKLIFKSPCARTVTK